MRKFFAVILFSIPLYLSACQGSPKAEAKKYADRMPDSMGVYRLEEDKTIELSNEAIGNTGHITLVYEANDIGEIDVVIESFGTESAAEVALAKRDRELRLMGMEFDSDRVPRYKIFPRADVATMPNGRLAIFSHKTVVIEVQFIKADPEAEITDEDWDAVLTAIREVGEKVAE
jgi:hypothetical protein